MSNEPSILRTTGLVVCISPLHHIMSPQQEAQFSEVKTASDLQVLTSEACRQDPKNIYNLINNYLAFLQGQQYNDADKALKKAWALDAGNDSRLLALFTNVCKKLDARNDISADVKALLYFSMGRVYFQQNKLEQAIEYFTKCLEFDKHNNIKDRVWLCMGAVYFKQNKFDEAKVVYEEALRFTSSSELKARCYYEIGRIYFRKNEFKQARVICEKGLGCVPSDEVKDKFWELIGEARFQRNEFKEAIVACKERLGFGVSAEKAVSLQISIGEMYVKQARVAYGERLKLGTLDDQKVSIWSFIEKRQLKQDELEEVIAACERYLGYKASNGRKVELEKAIAVCKKNLAFWASDKQEVSISSLVRKGHFKQAIATYKHRQEIAGYKNKQDELEKMIADSKGDLEFEVSDDPKVSIWDFMERMYYKHAILAYREVLEFDIPIEQRIELGDKISNLLPKLGLGGEAVIFEGWLFVPTLYATLKDVLRLPIGLDEKHDLALVVQKSYIDVNSDNMWRFKAILNRDRDKHKYETELFGSVAHRFPLDIAKVTSSYLHDPRYKTLSSPDRFPVAIFQIAHRLLPIVLGFILSSMGLAALVFFLDQHVPKFAALLDPIFRPNSPNMIDEPMQVVDTSIDAFDNLTVTSAFVDNPASVDMDSVFDVMGNDSGLLEISNLGDVTASFTFTNNSADAVSSSFAEASDIGLSVLEGALALLVGVSLLLSIYHLCKAKEAKHAGDNDEASYHKLMAGLSLAAFIATVSIPVMGLFISVALLLTMVSYHSYKYIKENRPGSQEKGEVHWQAARSESASKQDQGSSWCGLFSPPQARQQAQVEMGVTYISRQVYNSC